MLVGLAKTGMPGAGIPAVAMMAMAFEENTKMSVGALLPVLLVGDVMAVAYYHRHAEWKRLAGLFPFVVAGMIPAVVLLHYVEGRHFAPILGWLILILLALAMIQHGFRRRHTDADDTEAGRDPSAASHNKKTWLIAVTGILAGFGTMAGNSAGPVMSIYLLSMGLKKKQFIGTAAWFFLIVNASKVPFFWGLKMITPDTLHFDLTVVPGVVFGALFGYWILKRIPQRLFNVLVLLLAIVAAMELIGVWESIGLWKLIGLR